MNFFATTNVSRDNPSCIGLLLVAAALALPGCASAPAKKPAPVSMPAPAPVKPVVVVKPASPAATPAAPTSFVSPTIDPSAYQKHKNRIKLALSKNNADSLPASDVGYYMDVLQGRLKQTVGKTPAIGLARNGDYIVLLLSGKTGFEANSNQPGPATREVLASLSRLLVEYRLMLVSIRIRPEVADGRKANSPSDELRAQAIARYLVNADVSGKRLIVVAPISRSLIAEPAGRARIELQLEPIVRSRVQTSER